MNIFIWLWLGAIVLFGVAEMVTESMVSIWFVAGSLAALVTCMSGWSLGALAPEATQVLVFAVVSALALAATRPLVRRFGKRRKVATNADRVLGRTARVTEEINNLIPTGAVYVDGKTWTARSAGGGPIPSGAMVTVLAMEGVKLIVREKEEIPPEKKNTERTEEA